MIAQATMTRRVPAIRPAAAAPIRLAPAFQGASPVPVTLNRRNLAVTLAIAAAGFACAAVALGAITYQQARQDVSRDVTGIEFVRNETVVVRRAISPVEAPDETPSWNLPRLVRTVSFWAASTMSCQLQALSPHCGPGSGTLTLRKRSRL